MNDQSDRAGERHAAVVERVQRLEKEQAVGRAKAGAYGAIAAVIVSAIASAAPAVYSALKGDPPATMPRAVTNPPVPDVAPYSISVEPRDTP